MGPSVVRAQTVLFSLKRGFSVVCKIGQGCEHHLLCLQDGTAHITAFSFLDMNARPCVKVAIDSYLLKNVLSFRFVSLKQTHEFCVLLNF